MNIDILKELVDNGLSSYQIADKLKLSPTNVRYWLRKYKLQTKHKNKESELKTHHKCNVCLQVKELNSDNFYMRKNGKSFHHYCKDCNNKKVVELQRARKQTYIEYLGGKCKKCGYDKCNGALDFHHLDPSKKEFNISSNRSFDINLMKKELDKCIILCRNCHAEFHAGLVTI